MENPKKSPEIVVKRNKDASLRDRLKSLILAKGLSIKEFRKLLGMTRQNWYYYSWGVWPTPTHLKIKIAKILDLDSSVIWK